MVSLRSPGSAASARIVSEQQVQRALIRHMRLFLAQTARQVESGDLSAAWVAQEWEHVLALVADASPALGSYVSEALRRSTLGDDVYRAAQTTLTTARQQGWSASRTRREVRRALSIETASVGTEAAEFEGQTWRTRVETAARTAATQAEGASRLEALRGDADLPYKRWVTRHDKKVRPSHAAADGQTVLTDHPFQVGAHAMMYPGDPSGPIEETVNCRCVIVGVPSH